MSITTYAVLGIAMMVLVMVVLISGKTDPIIPMIGIPLVFALIMGATPGEIKDWTLAGLKDQLANITMFVFAIIFFGIMQDTGVFDVIVGKLLKGARNVLTVCLLTVAAAMVGHCDGSGATTFLIVVPPFLLLYQKMNMRPLVLMCLVSLTAGAMNGLPWGGPTGRMAGSFGLNSTDIFLTMLPAFLVEIGLCFLIAAYLAKVETKRGAGLPEGVSVENLAVIQRTGEEAALLRPKLFYVNLILIAATMIALFATGLPPYVCFMVASAVALVINYPGSKAQAERLKTYAPACLTMASVLMACGVFVGVLSYSPMQESMTILMTEFLSAGNATRHLNGILAYIWPVLDQLGLDHYACCYTIVPMIQKICSDVVSPMQAAVSYLIGWLPLVFVHPTTGAMYVGLGLAGVSFKDHWKFTLKWGLLMGWTAVLVSMILGVIKF